MASASGGGILVEYMFLLTLLENKKFRMSNVDLITSVVDFVDLVVVGFLYARPKLLEIFFVCRALRLGR